MLKQLPKSCAKKLAAKIIAMAKKDQAMRRRMDSKGLWDASVDKYNTRQMKKIIHLYGLPTISLVGKRASLSAWLLVQHADLDPIFQAHCLNLMKKAARKNPQDVDKTNIAYLTDRVKVNQGKKQLFGTQFYEKDKKIVPRPILDPKNLEKRRAKFNLEPFKNYRKRMENIYHQYQRREKS